MIVSAHSYKEELKNKLIEKWYDDKYIYYFADERSELRMPDNCEWIHHMVHLNSKGEVDGAFIYNYNASSRSISGISLISFVDNGAPLMMEFIKYMMDMFKKGARRVEFYAFTDNPACKQYDRIIAKYGGRKVGYLRETSYFDGRYHDMYIYEVHENDIHVPNSRRFSFSALIPTEVETTSIWKNPKIAGKKSKRELNKTRRIPRKRNDEEEK